MITMLILIWIDLDVLMMTRFDELRLISESCLLLSASRLILRVVEWERPVLEGAGGGDGEDAD